MGQIEINHTGSGGTIVLSSDGSDLLLGGSAVGGGADLYAANESSPDAQPSATGANAVAIGDSAVAAGARSFAFGDSRAVTADTLAAIITNNTTSYGAAGTGNIAIGNLAKTTSDHSVAIGTNATATGLRSTAIGYNSIASGQFALAVGIETTVAAGALALGTVAIGPRSFAQLENGTAVGYYSYARQDGSALGYAAKAQATKSVSIGSESEVHTDATGGMCLGVYSFVPSTRHGAIAFNNGVRFAAAGDSQAGLFVLRSDTTDATAEAMTTNNATAASTNQITIPSDSCIMFSGTIVAMQNGAQAYAGWKVEGILVNDGGTTTLPNSAITTMQNSSSWGLALSADNTNNALKVEVTGEASHNIRWVANIQTSEVTYA